MLNKSLWVIEDKNIQENVLKYSKNIRYFCKGNYIYQQEDNRNYLYFLTEGRVRVNISNANGSEKILAIHEPGSFFGEAAFLDELPSFSNAEALKDSTVVALDKDQFLNMMKDAPDLATNVFKSLSRKIRLLVYQVEYLSFMKIEERLISLLITLFITVGTKCSGKSLCNEKSRKFKVSCSNGYILDLTITDQEIGDMISARREAVTKAISSLKNQGLILKNNRTICCPDLTKLEEILYHLN